MEGSNNKLCLVYNIATKYRESIYMLIDKAYNCDWYFSHNKTDIKEMDTSQLKRVFYYKTVGRPDKLYWQRGILRLLFKKEYKIFFMLGESRCLTAYFFFFLVLYFFSDKNVNIWTHGWYGKETKVEAMLKLWMFRHVDKVFVYGNYAKQLLLEQGISEENICVIHNSLDYSRQLELRNTIQPLDIYRSHFGNSYPTLIFIGRLTPVKRLDLLINAVALLRSRNEHYNIVLVGDGEMRQQLKQEVAGKGLINNVWFYGACYDEQVNAKLIYNADLCVAPGNVGLTAIHTMVFGCPVITHNDFKWQMPEFEAIHPGITGDFFVRNNVEDLANSISNWFAKKQGSREEVRKACYNEIDTQWTPQFQIEVIKNGLSKCGLAKMSN